MGQVEAKRKSGRWIGFVEKSGPTSVLCSDEESKPGHGSVNHVQALSLSRASFIAVTKHLTEAAYRWKGLFWSTVPGDAVHQGREVTMR